jgi:nucleoside-diphosphate-sugar epimerase
MIAITGASGFVGSALARRLETGGQRVRRLIRSESRRAQDTDVVVGNIGTDTAWDHALAGVDCVVHCAARVHVMSETEVDPLEAFRHVNSLGSMRLAEAAAAMGVRRLIFLSSIKVLGEDTPPNQPFDARSEARPQDAYGRSKLEAEQALTSIAQRTGLELVIIRPPLVYGPAVGANFLALIKAVQRGWPLPLASIHNHRSLVGLGNLLDLIATCIHHPAATGRPLLVSDGDDLSTPDLIRHMATALGTNAHLLPFPVTALHLAGRLTGRSAQVRRLTDSLQVDITETMHLLGWRPSRTVGEELADTVRSLTP